MSSFKCDKVILKVIYKNKWKEINEKGLIKSDREEWFSLLAIKT